MAEPGAKSAGMRRQPRQARSQERVNQILEVAEQLFIAEGYEATTTNRIAQQAGVSIGSLYQFFPDKGAILRALASRYNHQLHQWFLALHTPDLLSRPLTTYVDRVIDAIDQFFNQHPGYHAVFNQLQAPMPELEAVSTAADTQLIAALAIFLAQRYPASSSADFDSIAFVLVRTSSHLLWLSLDQEPTSRQWLVQETKRLTLSYLKSYFGEQPGESS